MYTEGGTFFIICYPRGDRSKLSVAEISCGCDYEKRDYALASRQDYPTYDDASKRARELAKENGLTYVGSRDRDDHDFLD